MKKIFYQKRVNPLLRKSLRLSGLSLVLSGAACLWSQNVCAQDERPTKQEVAEIIHRVNRYWQTNNPSHGNFFWNRAVYHIGNVDAYKATGDCGYLDFSTAWSELNLWKGAKSDDKSKWKYTYGESDEYVLFGDCQVCFQVYSDLYKVIPEDVRIARMREVMEYQITTPVVDYWWWVDGLFMAMPIMTRLYSITGNEQLLEKMHEYWEYSNSIMYDYDEDLYYRDARYVYPEHQTYSGKKDFWARGDGWIFAAFARVLADLPKDDAYREEYITFYKDMAKSLAKSQQPEGYWTRSILDPDYAPGYETSGTALFAFGYLWGINNGILDESEYGETARRAWKYLSETALHENGRVGYIQPIGDKADPNQTIGENSTADFGVGAYLMAASEMLKYAQGEMPLLDLRITSLKRTDEGQIYVTFNDTLDAQTASDISCYTIDDKPMTGSVEFDGVRSVVLTPDFQLTGGKHNFAASGIKGDNGQIAGEGCTGTIIYTIDLTPCNPDVTVTAIGNQEGNTPENTIDNNLDTRWSQAGLNQWIRYDLGEVRNVRAVDVAFYLGSQRKSYFDIMLSVDGKEYTTVLAGCESCGTTDQLERFSFDVQPARYVMLNCNGNSQGGDNWNSITELRVSWENEMLDMIKIPGEVYTHIVLPEQDGKGRPISWKSSAPEVLSGDGLVNNPEVSTEVVLTADCADEHKEYNVTVMPRDPEKCVVASYEFEADDVYEAGHEERCLVDRSGKGRDARIMGQAVIDGKLNLTANTPDGFWTNGYLILPQGLLDSLRSYTVVAVVNPSSLDVQPRLYDFGSSSGNSVFLRLSECAAGMKYNAGTTTLVMSSEQPQIGRDQLMAVTYDAVTHQTCVYIDGKLTASENTIVNEPRSLTFISPDSRNYVGRSQWWDSNVARDNLDFCGTIDDFKIFSTALTEKEIGDMYNGTVGINDVDGMTDGSIALENTVVSKGEPLRLSAVGLSSVPCRVSVFSMQGALVSESNVQSLPCSVEQSLPSGCYVVSVAAEGTGIVASQKFIVK